MLSLTPLRRQASSSGSVDLLAVEVLGEDVVVGLGRGLEQLVTPARDLIDEIGRDRDLGLAVRLGPPGLAMDQVHVAAERVGRADRQLEGRDLRAERGAQPVERGGRIGVLAIALVDEEAGGRTGRPSERDGGLEPRLDATRGVDDEQGAVGGRETLDDLGREVRVAGRVDQRDAGAVRLERADRQAEQFPALLLLGFEVEVGRPVVHPTEPRIAPALNKSCSASVVLPEPTWPARTTLRRWGRSTLFIVIGLDGPPGRGVGPGDGRPERGVGP